MSPFMSMHTQAHIASIATVGGGGEMCKRRLRIVGPVLDDWALPSPPGGDKK